MAIVIFDPVEFKELYPAFALTSDAVLQNMFDQATIMCNNTECSIIPYDPDNGINERKILLYLLTAHLAELNNKGVVGTLTSATEGSVSTSFFVDQSKRSAYFVQTTYGYIYWQMTLKYRTGGMFVSGCKRWY